MKDHMAPGRVRAGKKIVGVRELKTHAARIVRQVREARASYVLTHRGRAVGVILPLDAADAAPAEELSAGAAWDAFVRAGRRLEGHFRPHVSGVAILSGSRR